MADPAGEREAKVDLLPGARARGARRHEVAVEGLDREGPDEEELGGLGVLGKAVAAVARGLREGVDRSERRRPSPGVDLSELRVDVDAGSVRPEPGTIASQSIASVDARSRSRITQRLSTPAPYTPER